MVLVFETVGVDVDRAGRVTTHHTECGEVVVVGAGRHVLVVDRDKHVVRSRGDIRVETVGELLFAHRGHRGGLIAGTRASDTCSTSTSGVRCARAGLLPGAHHRLGHVRLLRHAQRSHVGARVGHLGGIVRGRERHAVEHVRVRVGLLIGNDGAGGRTVDQIIGQSARVPHTSGQRRGRSILLRLDDAHHLEFGGRFEALFDFVLVVADETVAAVIALDVLVGCRNHVQRLIEGLSIVDLVLWSADLVAGVELGHHLVVIGGGQQAELVQRGQRHAVVVVKHQHHFILGLRP